MQINFRPGSNAGNKNLFSKFKASLKTPSLFGLRTGFSKHRGGTLVRRVRAWAVRAITFEFKITYAPSKARTRRYDGRKFSTALKTQDRAVKNYALNFEKRFLLPAFEPSQIFGKYVLTTGVISDILNGSRLFGNINTGNMLECCHVWYIIFQTIFQFNKEIAIGF